MTEKWLVDLSLALRSAALSSFHDLTLPYIAIYDDLFFENYDYDIISPTTRSKINIVASHQGFKQERATRLVHPDGSSLIYPKPARLLTHDPNDALRSIVTKKKPMDIRHTHPVSFSRSKSVIESR